MSEHESPNKLSSQTTPTWEVELLISGVAVFAMLQLPGWLDDGSFSILPRLDNNWFGFALLVYYYAKSAAVILAATFVIHLLLRARWIALVGMHSVYPAGVRWDRLRMGPVQRDLTERSQEPMEEVIERADNRATTVFAIGVTMALMLVTVTGLLTLVFSFTNALLWITGWEVSSALLPLLVLVLVTFPMALVTTLDRRYGARWVKGGWMHRFTVGYYKLLARAGMGRSNNRIMALLASNSGQRLMIALTFLVIGGAVLGVMFIHSGMRDPTRMGSYGLFPANGDMGVDASHYSDARDPARDPAIPFVQSMVITGPYLKLVLPYEPRRDGPALQQHCRASGTSGVDRNARLMACLQGLHALSIDHKPITNPRYETASDPRTDRPALLAMIDIRSLAQGRHELRVGRAPSPTSPSGEKGDEAAPDAEDYIIPFWR